MHVNLVFIELNIDNAEAVLQRIEFLRTSLSEETTYTIYQQGSEEAASQIQSWAARLPQRENCEGLADITLFAGTPGGKEEAMRFAAAKDMDCYSEVFALKTLDGETFAVRKVYSTHLDAYLPAEHAVLAAALNGQKKEFEPCSVKDAEAVQVYPFSLLDGKGTQKKSFETWCIQKAEREKSEDISTAKLVLLGGKGLEKKENFQRLEALAAKLGASCGCTRPVAMAGWTSYDKVVGLSGATLQADVCIAFGVSGAGPLMQGAKGASRLIAVNNDPKAPIFRECSDGLVADCLEILEAMEAEV